MLWHTMQMKRKKCFSTAQAEQQRILRFVLLFIINQAPFFFSEMANIAFLLVKKKSLTQNITGTSKVTATLG